MSEEISTRRDFIRRIVQSTGGIVMSGIAPGLSGQKTLSSSLPAVAILLRTNERHQIIENFGAADAWSMDPIGREWTVENREKLADLLFSREKGIGLSLWRFNIGAGGAVTDKGTLRDSWRGAECFRMSEAEGYDWNRQAGQQWFLEAAKKRGVKQFLACVYSPPVWMTANGYAHGDKNTGSTNLKPGCETAFARFLADVLQHFQEKRGIAFRYLSPLNEPNWAWEGGQEGCRYNNEDIIRLIRALHAELAARRLRVEMDVPEAGDLFSLLDDARFREWSRTDSPDAVYTGGNYGLHQGKYREYIRDLLGDPAIRELLGGKITAHSYWTDSGDYRLVDLRRMVRRNIDQYAPNGRYWMTEYCLMEHKRDLEIDAALRIAKVIHHDLVDAGASAWHWWLAVSPADYKDGLIYTDYRTTGQQNILPSRILWALGNYSRFIRPGARRIGLGMAPEAAGLHPSAYVSRDGKRLIIVTINENRTDQTARFSFDRAPQSLTPHVTSTEEALSPKPALPSAASFSIPARSIVTLVGDLPG
jgi:O-glycosyl hydrolase